MANANKEKKGGKRAKAIYIIYKYKYYKYI